MLSPFGSSQLSTLHSPLQTAAGPRPQTPAVRGVCRAVLHAAHGQPQALRGLVLPPVPRPGLHGRRVDGGLRRAPAPAVVA